MKRVDLCGAWELGHRLQPAKAPAEPEEAFGPGWEVLSAQVPGNVELALVEAGKLPDPFLGNNILFLRPYEFHEWWYRRTFPAQPLQPGQQAKLVFAGLDCFGTVWLNGRRLGDTANALIEHVFDVTDSVRAEGENEIVVRLASPLQAARARQLEPSEDAILHHLEGVGVRKPPHCYGWDIMPRLVSAGIWRPVWLEIIEPDHLLSLCFRTTQASSSHARLQVHWQFATQRADLQNISLRFTGVCGESAFTHTQEARFTGGVADIGISAPRLWWPKGYGDPNLYTVTTELLLDGKAVDSRTDRIGLRTVELRRTELAGEGGDFRFLVNGVPILVKGSNWVPADALHSRDAGRYPALLALAEDVGCNMLRCWGGNVYEDHAFFDLCDEKGILVWQDFAFACALYPQSPDFLETVRLEAESVIRKLRNHPSLAVWCGDNEIDVIYLAYGRDPAQNRISREVLLNAVRRCDPSRPYLPSSPYVSPDALAGRGRELLPEQHLWGPRNYYKSSFYADTQAHFIGEAGFHACPNVSSLRRFLSFEALWPRQGNEEWRLHSTDPLPKPGAFSYRVELMAKQIGELFDAVPDALEDFALASQIWQAEANKFLVEMVRLRKWRRTGILWWNLVDGWPQFSDAVVDYYLTKKLAYHYLKRVQQPLCLMIAEPQGYQVALVAGNDSLQRFAGDYQVRDADTDAMIAEGQFDCAPNDNRELARLSVSRGRQALWLIEWQAADVRGANHALIGGPPFRLERYRAWLKAIAHLDDNFDPTEVAR